MDTQRSDVILTGYAVVLSSVLDAGADIIILILHL